MSTDRIKQVLMGIGLLTVLGILTLAGVVAYLWWDAERQMADIETDSIETDMEGETVPGDAESGSERID